MLYPYNAIFDRGLLNTFEAALHSGYLCLKIPATFGVISVFGSQKDARNIEQGFMFGHKNVHFRREETDQQAEWPITKEASVEFKKSLKLKAISGKLHSTLECQTELSVSALKQA
jgi:hypothetical protein